MGVWHTILDPDGTPRQGFGDVTGQAGAPTAATAVACTFVEDADLHVFVEGPHGLCHSTRFLSSPNSWPQFRDVNQTAAGRPYDGAFRSIACAAIGTDVHCLGSTAAADSWRTVRYGSSTSWMPFRAIGSSASRSRRERGTPSAGAVTCARLDEKLHALFLGPHDSAGLGFLHASLEDPRDPYAEWTPFTWIEPRATREMGSTPAGTDIACCAIGVQLHVVLATEETGLFHTTIDAAGAPLPAWSHVEAHGGVPPLVRTDAAAVGDTLHVIGSTGTAPANLWHAVRRPEGTWAPIRDLVATLAQLFTTDLGPNARVRDLACAATSDELHIVFTTSI